MRYLFEFYFVLLARLLKKNTFTLHENEHKHIDTHTHNMKVVYF